MSANAGNTNTDGFTPQKTTSMPGRPGAITRGPGKNKPRIHLVSSKGKIPAEIIAHTLAQRQAAQNAGSIRLPKSNALPGPDTAHAPNGPSEGETKDDGMVGSKTGGPVNLYAEQKKNPKGVAPRPNPAYQNNPALAGRFTPQGKAWMLKQNAMSRTPGSRQQVKDNPNDSASQEAAERKRGIRT